MWIENLKSGLKFVKSYFILITAIIALFIFSLFILTTLELTFVASLLSGHLGLLTAFILSGTFLITFLQLRSAQTRYKAQYGIDIMKELRTKEWRDRLRRIYSADYSRLKGTELESEAEYTLDKLEWVGIMLKEKVFPLNLVMMLIGGLPVRVWYKLFMLVDEKREERGHYAIYVEYFTKRALKYQIEYYPMGEWTKLGTEEILSELIIKGNLITVWILRLIYFKRWFHAIGTDLNHRCVFSIDAATTSSSDFVDALKNNKVEEISEIFRDNDINFENIKILELS